jgi:tetratricopeptide (TPR) repeat protein
MDRFTLSCPQSCIDTCALTRPQWKECAEYYELALAINPLYMNTWFSLGCAYMRFDEWDKALRAFSRVVSLDPEVRYCQSWLCFFVSCFSILC